MSSSSTYVDPGLGPTISGVSWALTAVAVLAVTTRLVLRARGPSRWGLDDWLILLALVIQLIFMGFVTEALRWGAGRHDEDLTPAQHLMVIKWFWLSTTPAIFVAIIARLSAAALLMRIFGAKNWFKWFLIVFSILQTIGGLLLIITTWTQIKPVEALWNPQVKPTSIRDNKLLNDVVVNVAQSLFAFTDLAFVFLPVFIIWRLNMALKTKIGLGILLSLSLLSFVGSVMKPVTTAVAHTQYSSSLVILWSALEQNIVIIVTCVPTLRLITFMKLPLIQTIGQSMAHLFSSNRSRKSSEASAEVPGFGRSPYHKVNIKSQKNSWATSDSEGHRPQNSSNPVKNKTSDIEMSARIRRSDEYMVMHEAKADAVDKVYV